MDLGTLRHSAAHVLAAAVKKLYPNTKLGIGPNVEDGFYYDFGNLSIKEDDLEKIEKEMQAIIKKDYKFIKLKKTRKEAEKLFKNEEFKMDLLKDLKDDEITFYESGDFIDLCKGPHVKSTKEIKAFKLLKIASAYWKGDQSNEQLQRIYGTAFESQKELDEFIRLKQVAENRSHIKLGKELDLFIISPLVGPGLPLITPKGTVIKEELQKFLREEQLKHGYLPVTTPHIARIDLYKKSGHYPYYKETMFNPMKCENAEYILKPMNCPHHIQIYQEHLRSYRELPLRLTEFGTVYRYEKSGELNGLTRVRMITQDDAHLFCLDEKTELLTQKGWKKINEIVLGELAFSFNKRKNICELKKIKRVIKYNYKGKMFLLKNQDALDCLVTPEHRVLCKIRTTFKGRKQGLSGLRFIRAENLPTGMYIPLPRRLKNNTYCKRMDKSFLSILGWIITDGHKRKEGYYLEISQATSNANKPNLYKKMVKVIERRFPSSKVYLKKENAGHKESATFYLGVDASNELKQWFGDEIHRIPRKLLETGSPQQLKLLFASLIEGDGTTTKPSKNGHKQVIFYCGYNEGLADDFQELCTRLGFSATKKEVPQNKQFIILVSFKRKQTYVRKMLKRDYDGKVWDITIDGGAFVARREGKVFITGNCTEEQVKNEIIGVINLVLKVFKTLNFTNYRARLGTRDKSDKYIGSAELWKKAENDLEEALKEKKMKYEKTLGEAAFYGPKIDFLVKDVLGREWQLGTIQVDYNLPQRFELTYEGQDGKKHIPVMIHRAPFGSLERFIGILIEHFAGKFPLWLSPVQVKILAVNDRNIAFAREVEKSLKDHNIRIELNDKAETISRKVRGFQLEQVNYAITIGDKECEKKTLAVRTRSGNVTFEVKLNDFIKELTEKISSKTID